MSKRRINETEENASDEVRGARLFTTDMVAPVPIGYMVLQIMHDVYGGLTSDFWGCSQYTDSLTPRRVFVTDATAPHILDTILKNRRFPIRSIRLDGCMKRFTAPSGVEKLTLDSGRCAQLKLSEKIQELHVERGSNVIVLKAGPQLASCDKLVEFLKEGMMSADSLSDADITAIKALSQVKGIVALIIASILPSIHGQHHVKTAVALSLFGGVAINECGEYPLHGNINVLLVGDAGSGKSHVLEYCEKMAPRAVYIAVEQGASCANFTPTVRENGGRVGMPDKGVCLIDNFDGLDERDRAYVHQVMEHQAVPIQGVDFAISRHVRCAVIATTNPNEGHYDVSRSLSQNVNNIHPFLQQFDCCCVMQDSSNNNVSPLTVQGEERIPEDLLKKYILYSKLHVHPQLHRNIDTDKVTSAYVRARSCGRGPPVTPRLIESMIRVALAHARMHLRSEVTNEDLDFGIQTVLRNRVQGMNLSDRLSSEETLKEYLGSSTSS